MKDIIDGLKFWWRPMALVALFGVAALTMFTATTAVLWGPAIPITIGAGVLSGFDIYGHLAERHFRLKKLGPNAEENYKKELRRLERLRRAKVREAFSYKNYGSGKTYLKEALELEERIEAHKNGDDYKPKTSGYSHSRY